MATRSDIIERFVDGATSGKVGPLTIVGNERYSHDTVIGRRDGRIMHLNTTKYSSTTSTQQNELRRAAESRGFMIMPFSGRGASLYGVGGFRGL